jgi:galactokinase
MTSPSAASLVEAVRRLFAAEFGGSARVFFAPGRVNLLGAHLDYSGGDVMPLAVDKGIYVAARLRDDARLRLRSLDLPLAVDVAAAEVGAQRNAAHGWASYPLGVWRQFGEVTGRRAGVEIVFAGDLPMASGLSSSAAIEIATATALDRLHGTQLPPEEIAMVGHRAETGYVGIQCGIMDQFASAFGRPCHLLLLHCAQPRWEHVPLDPNGFEVLVLDTKKPRELAASGFNQRVRECGEALAVLRRVVREAPCLAAYLPADLERAGSELNGIGRLRARHVVTEMQRVADGVAALRRGDIQALGGLMNRSHFSARDDYQVSCDELDVITAAAREHKEVYGARLTGAGFGGCALALVRPGSTGAVAEHVRGAFRERFAVEPRFYVLHAGLGPREVA